MGVLARLELDGDRAALTAAMEDLGRRLDTSDGLLARIVAPTDDGVVLLQLWESPEARRRHADDPAHTAALEASGMKAAVRRSRSRVFEGATLQVISAGF